MSSSRCSGMELYASLHHNDKIHKRNQKKPEKQKKNLKENISLGSGFIGFREWSFAPLFLGGDGAAVRGKPEMSTMMTRMQRERRAWCKIACPGHSLNNLFPPVRPPLPEILTSSQQCHQLVNSRSIQHGTGKTLHI